MTPNSVQQWVSSRFPPHVAAVLWQQYLSAQDAIARIGTAALDFPAQKDLLVWPMGQGPNGEGPIQYHDTVLSPRWGSRRPIWPNLSVICPSGDPDKPDIPGTVAFIRNALSVSPPTVQVPYVFLDLEGPGWEPIDYVNLKFFNDVAARTERLIEALKRQLEDDVKVGIWGWYPPSNIGYWNFPDSSMQEKMLKWCEWQKYVLRLADWVAPYFYVEPKRSNDDWSFTAEQTAHAITQTITVARSYNPNLLVTPCLMPDKYKTWQEQTAPDTPSKTLDRALPADYMRTILEPCFSLGDGAMLWLLQPLANSPRPVFDWSLPWIPVLEERLVAHGVMPWSAVLTFT